MKKPSAKPGNLMLMVKVLIGIPSAGISAEGIPMMYQLFNKT